MPVNSIGEYNFPPADRVENFHGNQVVYINWEKHLMFCSPLAFPLPPEMPFQAFLSEVLPGAYGQHPQFADIKWDEVEWTLNSKPFSPDAAASLADNGIGHKSLLRMTTPGLNGIGGVAS